MQAVEESKLLISDGKELTSSLEDVTRLRSATELLRVRLDGRKQ